MFNVGSLVKININGLIKSCKNVQSGQGKIEVEYVSCPNKPTFWLDESNPNIITPKYLLRSATQALPMNIQQSNSMQIPMGNQHEVVYFVRIVLLLIISIRIFDIKFEMNFYFVILYKLIDSICEVYIVINCIYWARGHSKYLV